MKRAWYSGNGVEFLRLPSSNRVMVRRVPCNPTTEASLRAHPALRSRPGSTQTTHSLDRPSGECREALWIMDLDCS